MSYVGRILIVVQVILSLLFMAFAGAVFAIQGNWKGKYEGAQATLALTQKSVETAQEELTKAKRDHTSALEAEEQRANQFQAKNTALTAQVATLIEQNNRYEQEKSTLAGLTEAKSQEARFRQAEAEKQRVENQKLQAALDKTAIELRAVSDELFSKTQEHAELTQKYDGMLAELAYLKRIVASNKLETDPKVVEKMQSPPPPVEGIVKETRKNRTNNVQFMTISIGSDDGLVKNHELDVIRIPEGQTDSEWLGLVRVVDISPDQAVCEVVLRAKNGIIQEGDNVTTKL